MTVFMRGLALDAVDPDAGEVRVTPVCCACRGDQPEVAVPVASMLR